LVTILLYTLVGVLVLDCLPIWASPEAQSDQTTLQQCNLVAEDALQDELNKVTQQVFAEALAKIDLNRIVETQWQKLAIDPVIDAAVDQAVVRVRNEKALWDKFLSGWSADKAQELTKAVASATFEAEGFRQKVDALSSGVASELSQQIAVLSAESVSAAFFCLQTFIADKYANVLVNEFENRVQNAAAKTDLSATGELDTSILTVIGQHKTALGGVGVIIAAQIAKRIVREIGEAIADRIAGQIVARVLGRVGTELIPLVGWLVGAGLIAYDVYASSDGALPEIQTTLKSPEVKTGIRQEIVNAIEPEFRREAPQIARNVANDLFSQWREVKRNIRQVLELADTNPQFKTILNGLETPDDLARLVSLVGVALPALGSDGFNQAVGDGSLQKALLQPASSYAIIASTKSLDSARNWATLAGDLTDKVVELEIYKHKAPDQLSRPLLEQLVALNNRSAIEKLVLLDPPAIEALLTVSSANLVALASQLAPADLNAVAHYLPLLDQEQKNAFVTRLLSTPSLVTQLQAKEVQKAIASNQDLDAALGFLAAPHDALGICGDVLALLGGKVALRLFLYKYGTGQSMVIGLVGLLLVLIVLRLIWALIAWLVRPVTVLLGR
jgi:hypothetical protein